MTSFRVLNRRAGALFGVATLVLGTLVPGIVAAASITSRSIALSTSSADAAGVTYHVVFTSPSNTKDFVLDFCDSPNINTTCNAVSGLDVTSIATSTSGYSVVDTDANTATVTLTSAGTSIDVELDSIHNPTAADVFYARITTYAGASDYTNATSLGIVQDNGTVALATTDSFSVSGGVAETMTFCAAASGDTIGTGCSGTLTSPNLTLGAGGILTTTLSTGVVKTQISTNAVGGAVVYLKSDAAGCGGLLRDGTGTAGQRCGISPLTSAGAINTGDAKFGLKLGNLGGASSTTTAASGSYTTTDYFMNYVGGDGSGVTGPYGDAIYDTSGGPVSDGTADLTFGANISNLTPAGAYRATLNLIATGTF